MQLIDAHVHLDDTRLAEEFPGVLQRAKQAGICAMIVPGVMRAKWPAQKSLCETVQVAWPAYGLHPYFIADHQPSDLESLRDWIHLEHPIAVGECGLDYFRKDLDRRQQHDYFDAQLQIARENNLPVIIHANHAVEDVIHCIRASGHHKGMVHSYNGSLEQAKQLIDLGYYLSFGGAVTYERARKLRELVKQIPLAALLIETDAPDQSPASRHGERNEPSYLLEVLESISKLRSEPCETIAQTTLENTCRLFNLPLES